MKKVRMVISAAIILACVSSALAFTKSAPDIRQCINGFCAAQTTYSTVNNGNPKNPPFTPYAGIVGAPCPSTQCNVFNGVVYDNQ